MKLSLLVVVIAYKRPASLARLLQSLERVEPADCQADLLISVEGEGDPACIDLGKGMRWIHGAKQVIAHPERLGLRMHIESATDRVRDYDGIIILEEDLSVSPWMLHYCREAMTAYAEVEDIAQISLYSHGINEFSGLPFTPLKCDGDTWVAHIPSSWGQLYSRDQWTRYRNWLDSSKPGADRARLPREVYDWKFTWKRDFYEFISATGKWVVYPYQSLTTNHGDSGQNLTRKLYDLEVPLESVRHGYAFPTLDHCQAKYDEFYEPVPETLNLAGIDPADVTIDLYGYKPLKDVQTGNLLSSRFCRTPLRRYSADLIPLELNVRLDRRSESGNCISLGRTVDFEDASQVVELACLQVPRAVQYAIFQNGVAQGCEMIRRSWSYQAGRWLLFPLRTLRRVFRKKRGAGKGIVNE